MCGFHRSPGFISVAVLQAETFRTATLIDKHSQQAVKNAWRAYLRAQKQLTESRARFIEELAAAHELGGATFEDLGAITKLSRQRIGQYIKEVKQ